MGRTSVLQSGDPYEGLTARDYFFFAAFAAFFSFLFIAGAFLASRLVCFSLTMVAVLVRVSEQCEHPCHH